MAAASMATSTVPKAVLFPSNDAAVTAFSSKPSSLNFHSKPVLGRSYSRVGNRKNRIQVVAMAVPPPQPKGKLSEVVEESIKHANEVCAGDEKSGECAAAWDEVEEVSAAASDMRNKAKAADPLEDFCKDNPETDECRTYDN